VPLCTVIPCGYASKALRADLWLNLYRGHSTTWGGLDHARVPRLSLSYPTETMDSLRIAPNIEVRGDRVSGCTPWLAQLLVLFFYRRSVVVDRRRRRVLVTTRWFWILQYPQIIPFDRIARIIYRAQGLPSLSPYRYLSLRNTDVCDSAFFLISIAIKDAAEDRRARRELTLFSVWEQQPRDRDWIDALAGIRTNTRVGDETSGAIVDILHEYLGVPVASH
jgi:hypothetical protein